MADVLAKNTIPESPRVPGHSGDLPGADVSSDPGPSSGLPSKIKVTGPVFQGPPGAEAPGGGFNYSNPVKGLCGVRAQGFALAVMVPAPEPTAVSVTVTV
jgi:hypothetical protein